MKRRSTLRALLLAAATGPMSVWTGTLRAQSARLPKIGYLLLGPLIEPPTRERQAFLDGLREFGYVPGKTIGIAYASAESAPEFLDAVCADLLKQNVDVIVASGAVTVLAAQKAIRTVRS